MRFGYAAFTLRSPHISRTPSRTTVAYIRKFREKWRAEVTVNGQRLSKVCETKREAQAWAIEQEALGKDYPRGRHTLAQAFQKYREEVTSKKRGSTWENTALTRLLSYFDPDQQLADVRAPQIKDWRDKRLKSVSSSTVLREKNLLSNIFSVARNEWEWIDHNPFATVKFVDEKIARHQRWSWQLIKRVLRAGQRIGGKTQEAAEAFHISLRTAMRLSEALEAPRLYDPVRRVVRIQTKMRMEEIPVGRIAHKLLCRPPFEVTPNEASVLFSRLKKSQLAGDLTLRDARATSLTWMAKKVDVMTLAKISRHFDLEFLQRHYYRETASEIAHRI